MWMNAFWRDIATRPFAEHAVARRAMMRCLLMALAVAMVGAGCSSPDPYTNQLLTSNIAPGAGRKSVGIISAIGDKFSVQKIGFTVFQNSLDEVPIDSWGVDERVVATMTAQLSKRFEVKRINYSKAAFAEVQKPKPLFASNQEDYRNKIADILRGMASSQKCDLYVVVTKSGSAVGNTNQSVSGLGVLQSGVGYLSSLHLHALFEVRVYDGQTFSVLGHQRASSTQSIFSSFIHGPHREVDKSWWPEVAQSIAKDGRVKDATMALVEQSMTATVGELLLKE
jgi:hypothetical protein